MKRSQHYNHNLSWKVVFLLCVCCVRLNAKAIGGVHPDNQGHYQNNRSGKFTCLDNLSDIPFTRVNDDFCDCLDGSDEPGAYFLSNLGLCIVFRSRLEGLVLHIQHNAFSN